MKKTDLRPYVLAALATVYAAVFWVLQGRAPRDSAANDSTNRESPRPIWYDELPAGARPEVRLPPGWVIARAGDPPPRTRVAPARAPRIRTRSS